MSKTRHIGYAIFGVCSLVSAKMVVFEPVTDVASQEDPRGHLPRTESHDPLGMIHALRYYIYGLGVMGLLMVVEDHVNERWAKKRKLKDDVDDSNENG